MHANIMESLRAIGSLKTEQYSERIKPMCEVAIPSNEFEQGKK